MKSLHQSAFSAFVLAANHGESWREAEVQDPMDADDVRLTLAHAPTVDADGEVVWMTADEMQPALRAARNRLSRGRLAISERDLVRATTFLKLGSPS